MKAGVCFLYQILEPSAESLPLVDYLLRVNPLVPKILARGKLPIVEGCSYGYTKALMDLNKLSKRPRYGPFIGLRLPDGYDAKSRIEKRVDQLFEEGLVDEVKSVIDSGYKYSYPMRKGIIAVPIIELLERRISEDVARDKIKVGIFSALYSALREFLDVPGIEWLEHIPEDLEGTVSRVNKIVRRENKI